MSTGPPQLDELLIASVTPQNLERGVSWFSENLLSIKKARATNPWWRENSFFVETDLVLRPSQFIRALLDLGYERTEMPRGKGVFSVHGGIVEVWPVNSENPHLVEFTGNTVETISERKEKPIEVELQSRRSSTSIGHLMPGSYAVHADHGIGIFRGISNDDAPEKFYLIEYAPPAPGCEPDRLYVPVSQKDRLSPYIGFETPRIHRLGGTVWQITKRKVREDAERLARELLSLYARRESITRPPYEGDPEIEEEIRRTFPFAETEDQLRAEEEILRDLSRMRPMDRILCGDVGFGKTEIALRAAARVMSDGRQVTVLSPTTVLAAQHEKTFRERFKKMPFKIEMLSRLTAPHDETRIIKELARGSVDCVIGTHRLLSRDVTCKNIGLMIVDEEQRFGVKQKERFKELRAEIDILSLSATPIPRTLSLALAKIRDISRIATPPPGRKPIQTFVLPYTQTTIKRAAELEIGRGGQLYFLHNRIETIGKIKEQLQRIKLSRPVRIETVHGRMKEKEMVRAMDRFREKKSDILLATTIIENGIDISSANTLIVDDATRLGLAQAHQLRGRIGRSNTQAHAYFLYRPRHITEKSLERLQALQDYADLGAGYDIALRDLEIRGAGNILGREQSGAVNKVGFNLYCQMLADAVEEEKIKRR